MDKIIYDVIAEQENIQVSPRDNWHIILSVRLKSPLAIKVYKSLLAIIIVALTAILSALFIDTSSKWFNTLIKPDIYPPDMVFAIAWSIIYLLAAIVLARVLINKDRGILTLLISQLLLQILWCLVFFTLEQALLGLFIILILVLINNVITLRLMKKDELSAWLYFAVFCWLVYAATLNYSIVMLN